MFELNNLYGVLIPALFAFAWSKPGLYIQESNKLHIVLIGCACIVGIWSFAVNMIHLGISDLKLPAESHEKVIAYIDSFAMPTELIFMPSVLIACNFFLVWFSGKLVAHEKQNAGPPV